MTTAARDRALEPPRLCLPAVRQSTALLLVLAAAWGTTAGIAAQAMDHAATGAFNRALGVKCVFCHPTGDEAEPAARATARRMIAMVGALNERLTAVNGTVACWTCHAGARVPERIARARWEVVLAKWPRPGATPDDVKLTMAVYTASVGRTCAGCHDRDGAGPATPEASEVVRTMTGLFDVMTPFLPPTARTQCFMCHKGRPHPQVRPND